MKSFWLWWRGTDSGCNRAARRSRGKPVCRPGSWRWSFVPRLDVLEDRTLPSTLTVLNLNDSGTGSLRTAITTANAHPGDMIKFATRLHGTITLTSGELLITANVTINGPGANQLSISGNKSSRIFEIATSLNVTINDLTITHGYAVYEGGGILNDGSNLTLSGDDLTDNVVTESPTDASATATDLYANGGALDSLAGTLSITNCRITGNQALGAAGLAALGEAYGGGVNIQASTGTFSESTISDNVAQRRRRQQQRLHPGRRHICNGTRHHHGLCDQWQPGARWRQRGLPERRAGRRAFKLRLRHHHRHDLYRQSGGGRQRRDRGRRRRRYFGNASITASTFDQNEAIGGNGGFNSASNFQGTIDPDVDNAWGGAIYNDNQGITAVSDSSFSHNEAIGGNNATSTGTDDVEAGDAEGGAIGNQVACAATFSECTFDHNQALGGNGDTGSGPIVLVGTALGGTINSAFGGVATGGANTLTVSNCTMTQNDATGGDKNSGTASVAGLIGAGVGAGIANYFGGSANVSDTHLDQNQASGGNHNSASGAGVVFAGLGAGGGIFNFLGNYNSSGYGLLNPSVVNVSSCLIQLNQAQGGGGNALGGGLANLLDATTTVSGSFLIQNQADGGAGAGLGGGAYNDASSRLALSSCVVTLNQANGSPEIGGGIYTLGTFTDTSTVIEDNHASTSGNNIGP